MIFPGRKVNKLFSPDVCLFLQMNRLIIFVFSLLLLLSCSTPPELKTDNIPTVKPFNLNRYLGKWYEIARLPNRFEENLERVTADYSIKENGEIKVINRGFNIDENEWEEAEGRAWVPDTSNPSDLKVSFFWIFSSGYKVIDLDRKNYSWSMVTSSSKKYLWILSRSKEIDEKVYNNLLKKAAGYGFQISGLKKVQH